MTGVDRPSLFKQRRLLLGFTFALAAIHGLDVQLSGNVTAQGPILTFKHPAFIVATLWVAWIWSVWRYWQYERVLSSHELAAYRRSEIDTLAAQAVTTAIHEAIASGQYSDRGVEPHERVNVSTGTGEPFSPEDYAAGEWSFLNLMLHRPPGSHGKNPTVPGGANCTLEASEVAKIKRTLDLRLTTRYPHFTDRKAPYLLMWLAPSAGLIDLIRTFVP